MGPRICKINVFLTKLYMNQTYYNPKKLRPLVLRKNMCRLIIIFHISKWLRMLLNLPLILSPETSEALKIGHFSHLNNVRQMLLPAHSRVWE